MATKRIFDEASSVKSRAGAVDVTGPDDVDVTLSPEAALKTGGELLEKASEALGKQFMNEDARKRELRLPFPE